MQSSILYIILESEGAFPDQMMNFLKKVVESNFNFGLVMVCIDCMYIRSICIIDNGVTLHSDLKREMN